MDLLINLEKSLVVTKIVILKLKINKIVSDQIQTAMHVLIDRGSNQCIEFSMIFL